MGELENLMFLMLVLLNQLFPTLMFHSKNQLKDYVLEISSSPEPGDLLMLVVMSEQEIKLLYKLLLDQLVNVPHLNVHHVLESNAVNSLKILHVTHKLVESTQLQLETQRDQFHFHPLSLILLANLFTSTFLMMMMLISTQMSQDTTELVALELLPSKLACCWLL